MRIRRIKTTAGLVLGTLATGALLMGARSWDEPEERHRVRLPEVVVRPPAEAVAKKARMEARREARRKAVLAAARHYGIEQALARRVHRVAKREGIDPRLAFALVHVESRFDSVAVGPAGAVGLAQVMVATARGVEPGVDREDLRDPETNVRIGMRYLRSLLNRYDGDRRMALTAYNRGPTTVARARTAGEAPYNGYARRVFQHQVPCEQTAIWCDGGRNGRRVTVGAD